MVWWLAVAFAGTEIPVQGQLSGADGEPVHGSRVITVQLGLCPSGGGFSADVTSTQTVTFAQGAFAAAIDVAAASPGLLAHADLCMRVTLDGTPADPVRVGWAPRARYASEVPAAGVSGVLQAAQLPSDVILAVGGLLPASYLPADVIRAVGGLIPASYLPTDVVRTVAGTVPTSVLPTTVMQSTGGTFTGAVSGVSASFSGAVSGASLGVGTSALGACDGTNRGQIRYDGTAFWGCGASGWASLTNSQTRIGSTIDNPASSCKAIKTADASAADGMYWIGGNGRSFQAYCDMTNGGWTLCFSYDTAHYDRENWPDIPSSKGKLFSDDWGDTVLIGNGSKQGNFCHRIPLTAGTTRVKAEAVRVPNSAVASSAEFVVGYTDLFTKVHASREYDCLLSTTGNERLFVANYGNTSSQGYGGRAIAHCTGTANQHLRTSWPNFAESNGIDAILAYASNPSGVDDTKNLVLQTNWFSDFSSQTLYTSATNASPTKWGETVTWVGNAYGRSGASPGPNFCSTTCGYTNISQAVWKLRLWVK